MPIVYEISVEYCRIHFQGFMCISLDIILSDSIRSCAYMVRTRAYTVKEPLVWECLYHKYVYTMKMPKQWMCLYVENAYTIKVTTRQMCLYDNMMRVFTALFHIWYALGYSSIYVEVTRVPWTYLSLVARIESKAVVRLNSMIAPQPTAHSAARKTDCTNSCITRQLENKRTSSLVSDYKYSHRVKGAVS